MHKFSRFTYLYKFGTDDFGTSSLSRARTRARIKPKFVQVAVTRHRHGRFGVIHCCATAVSNKSSGWRRLRRLLCAAAQRRWQQRFNKAKILYSFLYAVTLCKAHSSFLINTFAYRHICTFVHGAARKTVRNGDGWQQLVQTSVYTRARRGVKWCCLPSVLNLKHNIDETFGQQIEIIYVLNALSS